MAVCLGRHQIAKMMGRVTVRTQMIRRIIRAIRRLGATTLRHRQPGQH